MRNLALVLLVGACSSHPHARPIDDADARKLLIDRNWIDRWPTSKTDKLHVYRFVPNMGGGVFQDRTVFKGTFELFRFETAKDEIQFDFPETHERVTSRFRIEEVDGPSPFDLRLTIEVDPRGPQTYFGIRSETDPDGHVLEQRLRQ